MKAKTKADLLKELKEKEEEISQLENDRDYWVDECNRLQEELDKYLKAGLKLGSSIIDISDFKFRLSLNGLLTPELKQFIKDYLKFYQED